jgi:Tfp pilus assembly protein PilN
MTPDDATPFSLDNGGSGPVTARSTFTDGIPNATSHDGAPLGDRRTRRSRTGTGPVPEQDAAAENDVAALFAPPQVDPGSPPKRPGKAPKPANAPKPAKAPRVATPRPAQPKPTRSADQLPIGGVPRVDLLPPELKEARAWRRARGRALLVILCGAVLVMAGVLAATWWARANVDARDAAQARTDELLSMQAEFAEVNAVQGGIRSAEQALEQAGATDILWESVLTDLGGTLPPQARVTSLTIEAPAPGTPLAPATDVLQGERAATVRFTALTPEVPDVAAWVRAVEQIDGVVFVAPRAAQVLDDEPGFTVEMSFDLGAERLRHAPEDAAPDGADDDATTEEDTP